MIDFVVPVYPDHLGTVSSSWLPDSASKLIIIITTIYWDWLTILTKEIVLVNADDTGERWSWEPDPAPWVLWGNDSAFLTAHWEPPHPMG